MDPAHCHPENPSTAGRLHIAPRERHQDDDAPPFFVHFEHKGKAMILVTPLTRESYSVEPQTAGG